VCNVSTESKLDIVVEKLLIASSRILFYIDSISFISQNARMSCTFTAGCDVSLINTKYVSYLALSLEREVVRGARLITFWEWAAYKKLSGLFRVRVMSRRVRFTSMKTSHVISQIVEQYLLHRA
jgi:hypothetical protein